MWASRCSSEAIGVSLKVLGIFLSSQLSKGEDGYNMHFILLAGTFENSSPEIFLLYSVAHCDFSEMIRILFYP